MVKLTSKRATFALLLTFVAEQILGTPSAYALPATDSTTDHERMSQSTASQIAAESQKEALIEVTIEQKNTVLELETVPNLTASLPPTAPPPYVKTIAFGASPVSVMMDSVTVDLKTNGVKLTRPDGKIYTGVYDAGTKKAFLSNPNAADGVEIMLQFVDKSGVSVQYPELAIGFMRFRQGDILKDYLFSDGGQLESYTFQNPSSGHNETVGITRLDSGRWQVSDQIHSQTDLDYTDYTGFLDASELADFDQKQFSDQQNTARIFASTKTYFKWKDGLFAEVSYKVDENFQSRLIARSSNSGILIYIVVGKSDYQSGETDDILVNDETLEYEGLPGYTLSFEELAENGYTKGFGIIFTSPAGVRTLVDFPSDDLLRTTVDGQDKVFHIFVDERHSAQVVDVTERANSTLSEIADAFTALADRKSAWDGTAADLNAQLAEIDSAALDSRLTALLDQANQIKTSTQDRKTQELVSAWTAQAMQTTGLIQAAERESAADELARLRAVSQSIYASGESERDAATSSLNYETLQNTAPSLHDLAANYDPVSADSLSGELDSLQSAIAALNDQFTSAVTTLSDLQNQMTRLLEGLNVPEKNKINTAGWEDSVYVTPDGKTMYFSYAPVNFYDFLVSGGQAAVISSGPARDGHHANTSPFENSDLYVSHWVDGKWSAPENMGINSTGLECSAMVSADGNSIYINKPSAPNSDRMDLYVARKNSSGVWGTFQAMNIPKLAGEYAKVNPHMSADGKTVYFAVTFDINGQRNNDLYYSVLQRNGVWGTPQNLGPSINSPADENEIWVSSDGNSVYFTRAWELYSAKKTGGVWQPAVKLDFGQIILGGGISLTADQKQLFFSQVDIVKKDRVIVTSYLQADGRWSRPAAVEDADKIPTSSLPPGMTFDSSSYVDLDAPAADFNKMILGSNTQWIDNGDEMMIPGTLNFDPEMLAKAKAMAPTVLRYPGGDLSDTYNWRNGIGSLADRTAKASANTRNQPILFGTDEMLRLCAELGSEPIFTVNIMTMTAQDAADWVRYTNVPSSRVKYWEIGNEPYLNSSITPEQYAVKVNDFIKAMKAVDPAIQFGVALRTSTLGASDFNERFLAAAAEKFDYVTVHNSYFPLSFSGTPSDKDLYEAAMASAAVVQNDFAYFDTLLKQARPGQNIPVAVTEFNAIFSIQEAVMDTTKTPTFTSALYVADLLASFAKTPNLLMANFWSLTGNGDFGAVSNTGETRPVYEVFTAYAEMMKGKLVTLDTVTPVFENSPTGLVFSNQNAEAVTTLATLEGSTLRVMVLNKDIDNVSHFRLMLPAGKTIVSVRVKKISDDNLFGASSGAEWIEVPCAPNGDYLDLNLDPHSISYLEIEIQ